MLLDKLQEQNKTKSFPSDILYLNSEHVREKGLSIQLLLNNQDHILMNSLC